MLLKGFDKGPGGFPELPSRGFLAQPDQSLDNLLHVVEMGLQISLANHSGECELVHLAELADMTQNFRVLQTLGHVGRRGHLRGRKIGFEQ